MMMIMMMIAAPSTLNCAICNFLSNEYSRVEIKGALRANGVGVK